MHLVLDKYVEGQVSHLPWGAWVPMQTYIQSGKDLGWGKVGREGGAGGKESCQLRENEMGWGHKLREVLGKPSKTNGQFPQHNTFGRRKGLRKAGKADVFSLCLPFSLQPLITNIRVSTSVHCPF